MAAIVGDICLHKHLFPCLQTLVIQQESLQSYICCCCRRALLGCFDHQQNWAHLPKTGSFEDIFWFCQDALILQAQPVLLHCSPSVFSSHCY